MQEDVGGRGDLFQKTSWVASQQEAELGSGPSTSIGRCWGPILETSSSHPTPSCWFGETCPSAKKSPHRVGCSHDLCREPRESLCQTRRVGGGGEKRDSGELLVLRLFWKTQTSLQLLVQQSGQNMPDSLLSEV